jgi:2-methylisocitrate lyase-like PEP mutase family enzyme
MTDGDARVQLFRDLHRSATPLLMPNPWDVGSACALAALGFQALATTSSGMAQSMGRLDGNVSRVEALNHARTLVGATALPVSADLENGFADAPSDVAQTVRDAIGVGLAGCSIEDFSGNDAAPIYALDLASDRVAAAAEAARSTGDGLVLTARAENYLHGRPDLGDTIERLQAFQDAGADVLYAPGLTTPADISSLVSSVDRPVNVLLVPTGPTVSELAELGVSRISIGGSLANAALGAIAIMARDLQRGGPHQFWDLVATGRELAQSAYRE